MAKTLEKRIQLLEDAVYTSFQDELLRRIESLEAEVKAMAKHLEDVQDVTAAGLEGLIQADEVLLKGLNELQAKSAHAERRSDAD